MVAMVRMENGIRSRMESSAGVYSGKSGGESMKRPQKLAVMLVPTPPYEICGLADLEVGNFWRYNDWEGAVAAAEKEQKPIFVLFR